MPDPNEDRDRRELSLALAEAFRLELNPPADPVELYRRKFNLSSYLRERREKREARRNA